MKKIKAWCMAGGSFKDAIISVSPGAERRQVDAWADQFPDVWVVGYGCAP